MEDLLKQDLESDEEDDDYIPQAKELKEAEKELNDNAVGKKRDKAAEKETGGSDVDDLWAMMNEDDGFSKRQKKADEPVKTVETSTKKDEKKDEFDLADLEEKPLKKKESTFEDAMAAVQRMKGKCQIDSPVVDLQNQQQTKKVTVNFAGQ